MTWNMDYFLCFMIECEKNVDRDGKNEDTYVK